MTQTIPLIEALDYKTDIDGQIIITVDTGDEQRPTAEFVGRYTVVPLEEDRFSYSLSTHYIATVGYWVEFDITKAYYINDHGHELEEFDYDSQDIDEIEYYLTEQFKENDGEL